MAGEPLPQLRQGQRCALPVRTGEDKGTRTALQRQHYTRTIPFQRFPYPPPQRSAGELGGDQHLCAGSRWGKGFRNGEGQVAFLQRTGQLLGEGLPSGRFRPVGQDARRLLSPALRQYLAAEPVPPRWSGGGSSAHQQDAASRQGIFSRPQELPVRCGLVSHGDGSERTGESWRCRGRSVGEKKRQGV